MNSVAAVRYEDFDAYDWHRDCDQRLSRAAPDDTVRGLFFNGTLDAIRMHGGEELVRNCLEACGQEQFVDFFSYPVSMQLRMISIAMQPLQRQLGGPKGTLRHLGRCMSQGFLRSTAGRMMLRLAAGNPKRLVDSLPSAYRVSTSYGEHFVQWTGPRSGRLIVKGEFMPYLVHEGVLTALLEAAGAREVRMCGRQTSPLDSECEFSWN